MCDSVKTKKVWFFSGNSTDLSLSSLSLSDASIESADSDGEKLVLNELPMESAPANEYSSSASVKTFGSTWVSTSSQVNSEISDDKPYFDGPMEGWLNKVIKDFNTINSTHRHASFEDFMGESTFSLGIQSGTMAEKLNKNDAVDLYGYLLLVSAKANSNERKVERIRPYWTYHRNIPMSHFIERERRTVFWRNPQLAVLDCQPAVFDRDPEWKFGFDRNWLTPLIQEKYLIKEETTTIPLRFQHELRLNTKHNVDIRNYFVTKKIGVRSVIDVPGLISKNFDQ